MLTIVLLKTIVLLEERGRMRWYCELGSSGESEREGLTMQEPTYALDSGGEKLRQTSGNTFILDTGAWRW